MADGKTVPKDVPGGYYVVDFMSVPYPMPDDADTSGQEWEMVRALGAEAGELIGDKIFCRHVFLWTNKLIIYVMIYT